MNTLSNGAVAVGSEGSIMRLITAYEHELELLHDSGVRFAYDRSRIPEMARKMIQGAANGQAIIGPAFASAAKACGIKKPSAKAIQNYIQASGFNNFPPNW